MRSFQLFCSALLLTCAAVSAQAANVPAPWADVRAFGAVGDGKHDDTDAFKAAIKTGLPVLIAPTSKAYVVSSTLYVGGGATIMGLGRDSATVRCTGTGACFATAPGQVKKFLGVTYKDFSIEGTGNTATTGIYIGRTNYATVQNIEIGNIGGIGLVIDGSTAGTVSQAHYGYIANVRVYGNHRIGLQLRGPEKGEGTNRHRVFFLKDDGAKDVGLDIMAQSSTSQFYGAAFENVQSAIRIAGTNNNFFGLNIENVKGDGISFIQGARGNRFEGVAVGKVIGTLWKNPQFNPAPKVRNGDQGAGGSAASDVE